MPIAAKCQEIDCGGSDPSCRTVDQALTFCRKWSTFNHPGRPVSDLKGQSLYLYYEIWQTIYGMSSNLPCPHSMLC
ncbi:hypothetical protein TNIN_419351 [Trichonephila inaurata madagascariensis]|uniref:Uncharacterized protein n=1 Tax=Trichonephila inaurata madagascariensis TaxID=2747483 RepID=A0A8X6XZU2_9ARAC|nr:hypothetical protein TNIN_419351 [Trichonephila inaurata madagascariensis]